MSNLEERVLMYSGGMDSVIAWHLLGKPPCVYAMIEHRYQANELRAIHHQSGIFPGLDVRLIRGPDLSGFETDDAHIPGRNMYLAAIGSLFANKVYLVFQMGERELPDRSSLFLLDTARALSTSMGHAIHVDGVFPNHTKAMMVRELADQSGKEKATRIIRASWSCYVSGALQCGHCAACLRRYIALRCNGISEEYAADPRRGPLVEKYLERAHRREIHYKRAEEIIQVLGQ